MDTKIMQIKREHAVRYYPTAKSRKAKYAILMITDDVKIPVVALKNFPVALRTQNNLYCYAYDYQTPNPLKTNEIRKYNGKYYTEVRFENNTLPVIMYINIWGREVASVSQTREFVETKSIASDSVVLEDDYLVTKLNEQCRQDVKDMVRHYVATEDGILWRDEALVARNDVRFEIPAEDLVKGLAEIRLENISDN